MSEKRCPRPCSFCGRLDIPVSASMIKYGFAKEGETLPVCGGYKNPCKGDVHPCSDCVLYAPRPWPTDYKVGEVKYEDKLLGRIPVPTEDDSKSMDGAMGHIGRTVLLDLIVKNPAPAGMAPQEWILWTLRGIGHAMFGKRNEAFETHVMQRFLRHHGAMSGMELLIQRAKGLSSAQA